MVTPVRRQYLDLKARHPNAILLFRLGDFYETFDDDAKLVAQELDIALTSKPMGGGLRAPLAGVPVRSVDHHLARLVAAGHRVAICEQLERPGVARKLVRRGVVRVVSPGTALEPSLLEAGAASACAALRLRRGRRRLELGIAAADITTGALHLAELSADRSAEFTEAAQNGDAMSDLWRRARNLLDRLGVRELLLAEDADDALASVLSADGAAALPLTRRPASDFREDRAARMLEAQFQAPPAAFGLERHAATLGAVGALIAYLRSALPAEAVVAETGTADPGGVDGVGQGDVETPLLPHLDTPRWIEADAHLQWDAAAQRALAVLSPSTPGDASDSARGQIGQRGRPRTLLEVIDRCGSAMGRRWLRAAVGAPLLDLAQIERRLDRVEALVRRPALRRVLAERLRRAPDLERLFARAVSGIAPPPELSSLARGLADAAELPELIRAGGEPGAALDAFAARLGPAPEPARRLFAALAEQPASEYGRGVVVEGADPEVDRQRDTANAARARLSALESTLQAETGIAALRIGFHRTFGYHIELRRGQAAHAPDVWERRQSLRDRERFTEPRLREIERELEAAEQRLAEAERACVDRLRAELAAEADAVRQIAATAARLDAAVALASVAAERAWTRPQLDHSGELEIEGGRHPIVEAAAAPGAFVPNDLRLADDGVRAPQLLLVTGPNMAGKSTYLRQAALIVILAQAGAFVPAERARIGLVDRIFARVGAHDDLAGGRSTFMVEMLETARLLHGATPRSLLLLDEIGRGTSTWDGLAIAQSVAERLVGASTTAAPPADDAAQGKAQTDAAVNSPTRGPRTLFATHFHELTVLAGSFPRIANAAVRVEESAAGALRFLYRIEPGAADRSYGVQVAEQAGLPAAVVARAQTLFDQLERGTAPPAAGSPAVPTPNPPQLMLMPAIDAPTSLNPPLDPLVQDLADLDVDGITPLEAISALYALRDQARSELRARRSTTSASRSTSIADAGS